MCTRDHIGIRPVNIDVKLGVYVYALVIVCMRVCMPTLLCASYRVSAHAYVSALMRVRSQADYADYDFAVSHWGRENYRKLLELKKMWVAPPCARACLCVFVRANLYYRIS